MTGRRKEPASSIRRYRCGPAPPDASRPRVIAQKVLLLCIPDNAVDEGDIEIAENRKRLIGDGGRDLLLRHHNQDTGILGDAPPLKPTPKGDKTPPRQKEHRNNNTRSIDRRKGFLSNFFIEVLQSRHCNRYSALLHEDRHQIQVLW